jgi:hypothetical protein
VALAPELSSFRGMRVPHLAQVADPRMTCVPPASRAAVRDAFYVPSPCGAGKPPAGAPPYLRHQDTFGREGSTRYSTGSGHPLFVHLRYTWYLVTPPSLKAYLPVSVHLCRCFIFFRTALGAACFLFFLIFSSFSAATCGRFLPRECQSGYAHCRRA